MEDETTRLPIRIVVRDDLERSRLTVFFRIFIAIPHLIVVGLWGVAAVAVAVVLWLALLFEGRAPKTLQSFVAGYLRYSVQVAAYVHLVSEPFPRFGGADGYPIDLEIEQARTQTRGRVAARLVLALPVLLIAAALGGGAFSGDFAWFSNRDGYGSGSWSAGAGFGGVASAAAVLGWFATMARGRMPRGLRDLAAYAIAYTAQVMGFLLLVTDRYPTADPTRVLPHAELPPHPVELRLDDGLERSRLTVFFRLLLAIPHLIWLALWTMLALLAAVVAWFAALATGRVPLPLHRFIAAWTRYSMHVGAFLSVVGGPFPGFVGAAGSYPVDLVIAPPERQRRSVTLFRFWLAIPAFVLSSGYSLVLYVVALLGWWVSLFTGRFPEGIRNLGAVSLRYTGQVNAYLFLLTDRYPDSGPAVRDHPRDEQLQLELEPPAPYGVPRIEPA